MRWARLALLLLAAPVLADEAVDRALADLDSDDLTRRVEAEKSLMNAGPEGYEPCRRALDAAKDEETRARLGRVVDWLELESKTTGLAAVWKDRWFVVTAGGKTIGWEHEQAEAFLEVGRRGWKVTTEAMLQDDAGAPTFWNVETHLLHDPFLTPTRCVLRVDGPAEKHRVLWTIGDGNAKVRILEARKGEYREARRRAGSTGLAYPYEGPCSLDTSVAWFIERASLARRERVEFQTISVLESPPGKCRMYRAAFAGEEEIEVRGEKLKTRHYVHDDAEVPPREDWWVHDERGVVRAKLDRVTIEHAKPAEVDRTRPDPTAIAAADLNARLAAVAGEPAGREAAEQALLSLDDRALESCRKALAAAPDDDARARLDRVCRWLDPADNAEELAAMWKEGWFVAKDAAGAWVGSEHFTGKSRDIKGRPGWEATTEVHIPGVGRLPARMSFRVRTFLDGSMSPHEILLTTKKGGKRSRIRLRFERDWIELAALEVNGEKPASALGADGYEAGREDGGPWTLDIEISRLLERASLARLPALEMHVVEAFKTGRDEFSDARFRRYRYAGEETLEFDGTPAAVRRYVLDPDEGRPEEYWIEDRRGLLQARVQDLTILRTDEEGAKKK